MEFEEGAVGMEVEHLHTEKFSDNSEAEIGLITIEKSNKNRKRKRGSQTDVSCSSYSSGAGSPLNLPWCLGYIGKAGFESTDENSDGSRRSKSFTGLPGYHSATTATVTDSEDEIDFPNDVTDLDTFSVEYEPPETNSEDEGDDDDSDEEQIIIIPSSSEDEDPGAEGGDEFDLDSDSEDSWECTECWTMNYPMTTKCLMCWKERTSWVKELNRLVEPSIPKKTDDETTKTATSILLEKKMAISLSRSSSSCSSSTQTSCDSGVCVSSCETDSELHKKSTETTIVNTISKTLSFTVVDSTDKVIFSQDNCAANGKEISLKAEESINDSNSASNNPKISERVTNKDLTLDPPSSKISTKTGESMPPNLQTVKEIVQQKEDTLNLCVVCSTKPRNASIIHGRSGHQVCCFTCAEKLKADKKRCPVCRRRIHNVIKNFL